MADIWGYIMDSKSFDPIGGVSVTHISNRAEDKGKALTKPVVLSDASYHVWTDWPSDQVALSLQKNGYKTLVVPFSILEQDAAILMEKRDFNLQLLLAIPLVLFAVAVFRKKTKRVGKIEQGDLLIIAAIIGGILGLNIIIKVLKKLGLWGDPTTHDQQDPNSPWKPGYWQNIKPAGASWSYAINEDQAKQYAKTIHNAFTVFQDDYNAISSVFFSLQTKANVSFLSWVFSREYDEDLLSFLTDGGGILPWDGLSNEHMTTLINYVNKLRPY